MSPLLGAVLSLLLGVVLCPMLPHNRRRALVGIAAQVTASALVLLTVLPIIGGDNDVAGHVNWSYPVDLIAVRVDGLAAFFLAFSLPIIALGSIYAYGYMQPLFASDRNVGVHYALLNLLALAFIVIYTVENALVFLLGWEMTAIAAWLLIIWDYHDQKIRFAGFNYLVATHIGLIFVIAAFSILFSQTQSFDFSQFATSLQQHTLLRDVTFVLLVLAFCFKSAFFPMHTWLPRAHGAAPAPVSALLSGVVTKAGLYGILRFTLLINDPDEWMGWFLIAISLLSAIVGVCYTVTQRDLKRLLGYSTTEHIGIACLGFGLGCLGLSWHQPTLVVLGFAGGLLHILNHALFKCLLFYAAGAVHRATHSVDMERLGGLARSMPHTASLFLFGAVALAALPPLSGFFSEFLLYSAMFYSQPPNDGARSLLVAAAALLAFVGAIAALAVTRAFGVAFLGAPRDAQIVVSGDPNWPMRSVMMIHAFALLLLGMVPFFALRFIAAPTRQLIAMLDDLRGAHAALQAPIAALTPVLELSGILVLLIVFLAAWRKYALPTPAVADRTWGCGYGRPSARMQYSGASFSAQFANYFKLLLAPQLQQHLPYGPFPTRGYLRTHTVDAVEHRMFEVLGTGEVTVADLAAKMPKSPRTSFAFGLIVLLAMIALILVGKVGAT